MTPAVAPAEICRSLSDRTVEFADEASAPVGVRHADGTVHYPDGTIDHPDGTVELDGYLFDPIDWDELDPPEGSPEAEEIPHEVVVAEIRKKFGWKA